MMKLGCCAFCFKGWGLERAFAVLTGMGFHRLSVGMNHEGAQVNPLQAVAHPKATAEAVRAAADRYGVELVELFVCPLTIEPGRAVEPNEPDTPLREEMIARFEHVCAFAAAAGFENIMSVPGNPRDGLRPDAGYDLSVGSLNRMEAMARAAGVILTIEPHRWSILQDENDVARMLNDVPGLRLTLDYAHFVGKGLAESLFFALHERTQHLHARPARHGAFVCPFHENEIDFAAILEDLDGRDWSGTVSVECFGDPETDRYLDHPATLNSLMAAEVARLLQA